MKKSATVTGILAVLFLFSCEKKTTTTLNEDGGSTTVETVGLDRQRIDSTAEKVEEGVKDAAAKTGEALEDAGEKLKEGAKDAQKDINKATDRKRDSVR